MIYFKLNEGYLDSNQQFYDYGTKAFNGRDPFDITRGESSFVRQLLNDPDYMAEYKNLKSEIIQMTPKEYFESCAKIFDSSFNAQVSQIKNDVATLDKLRKVLTVYGRTFPITYLNYAERGQEGRHRMYVVGEMLGWDKKFPVLVINWYNQQLEDERAAKRDAERRDKIVNNIDWAVDYVKNFYVEDVESFEDELLTQLTRKFNPNQISININNDMMTVTVQDVSKSFDLFNLNIEELLNEF